MDFLVKVGSKFPDINDQRHFSQWRDGQIIDIREDGAFDKDKMSKVHHCILKFPDSDFWDVRGSRNWKSTNGKIFELKKLISTPNKNGKFNWESESKEKPDLKRLFYFDFQWLLDNKLISLAEFESIYDKSRAHLPLIFRTDFNNLLKNEKDHSRLNNEKDQSKGTVSTGTYTIGAAGTHATLTAAEADIAATLTGNLTFEHLNEETAISSYVIFDTNTNSYLLKITAQSGAEHNGGAYGNGARINFGTNDAIYFDETTDGHLANVEVSKLAIDASGSGNYGIYAGDLGGTILCDRLLIAGNPDSSYPARFDTVGTVNFRNNIVYGFLNTGLAGYCRFGATNSYVYNNTVIKCRLGILRVGGTVTIKNNIVQGCSSDNYSGSFTSNGYNVSEDATSPDSTYRSKNLHDGNSCFQDYANNDYRLVNTGDEISTLENGEDLSGTFTDDIRGLLRSTWYMGAYEIESGTPVTITDLIASAIGKTVSPEVIKGAITFINLVASSIGKTVSPETIKGEITLSGLMATAVSKTLSPEILKGAVILSGLISSATGKTIAAQVIIEIIIQNIIASAKGSTSGTVEIIPLQIFEITLKFLTSLNLDLKTMTQKDIEAKILTQLNINAKI